MADRPSPTPARVHPERVRLALDPRLDDRTIERLMACGRLRARLDARLGLSGSVPDAFAWLLADPAEAARRAGALLHGRAVRAVLSGPDVVALVAAIGREAHALALRHGALAPPRDHAADLPRAILHDGQACLGAWLRRRDVATRSAVLAALPPGTAADAEDFDACLDEMADAIVARVARSFEGAHAPDGAGGPCGEGP